MEYEPIVTDAGGSFLGVVEGFVWFNAPSGSTLVIGVEAFSFHAVRAKLEEDARKPWGKAQGDRKDAPNRQAQASEGVR